MKPTTNIAVLQEVDRFIKHSQRYYRAQVAYSLSLLGQSSNTSVGTTTSAPPPVTCNEGKHFLLVQIVLVRTHL